MFRGDPIRLGLGWGWQLGTGVATYSVTPALYALIAVSLVLPSGIATTAVGGLYGLLRGSVILWFALREARLGHPPSRLGAIKRSMKLPVAAAVLLGCLAIILAT
jgi:hypothetical protein